MKFYVLTLFPDMIRQIAETSITGRAIQNGTLSVEAVNIRDFSTKKTMRVDDYPYGGGAGMVMEAEPVFRAVQSVVQRASAKPRVIYMTPQAKVLDQMKVEELSQEEELIILCGHYEGIDDRVLQECVDDYISIGDYVLTGGELGAAVLIDAVSRFVPGVLSNEESAQFESMQDNLLEYPQYTRPEVWHEKKVPEILLCGDHKKVEIWRREQSLIRTEERRPDLMCNFYEFLLCFGGNDQLQDPCNALLETITHYGVMRDYNRRKIQKMRYRLPDHTWMLLVIDQKDPIAYQDRYRNLYGSDTPVTVLLFNSETIESAGNEQDTEEIADSVREAELREWFAEKKFTLVHIINADKLSASEEMKKTAFAIREKALHFSK